MDAECFVHLPLGNLSAGLLRLRHFPLHAPERVQYARRTAGTALR